MKRLIITICVLCFGLNINAQDLPDFAEAERLMDNVNSNAEEAKVVLSADGNTMYFVRAYHSDNVDYDKVPANEDIWEAVKADDGTWAMSEHEKTINDEKNNSIIGQGKEDHFFLLNTYQNKQNLQYGIALTKKQAKHNWSKPTVIEIPKLKYQGSFYDFFITNDEKTLVISIKGDDTNGQEDLYVSHNKGGKWSAPLNLGNVINSKGFEMSPFLSADKKFLYFSTDGREDGLGNADVYVSERLDDSWTNWSAPKNMGDVINSPAMDCYFTYSSKGEYYFSSNRNKETGLDIYRLKERVLPPMVTIKGKVINKKDNSALAAKINIHEVVKNEELAHPDKMEETYEITVPAGGRYSIHAEKTGFYGVTENVDVSAVTEATTIEKDVYLTPIEEKAVIVLENIFFDFDKFDLKQASYPELDRLIKILTDNATMEIMLTGHTDDKGEDDYNLKLSDNRVQSVLAYLVSKGVDGKRLEAKGMGEKNHKVANDTEENRQINRRVEFKITKK